MTKIKNISSQILSTNWGILKKLTYEYLNNDNTWSTQVREVYDRGDGATILLFNDQTNKIILTKQFRIPTYLNKNLDGTLIETCAGKLDEDSPDECIIREVLEETGYKISNVTKVFEAYMSPGSVTELIHFYFGKYNESMKVASGGGKDSEQENITVLEMDFDEAIKMVQKNIIRDGKTIMLIQQAIINQILPSKQIPHHG